MTTEIRIYNTKDGQDLAKIEITNANRTDTTKIINALTKISKKHKLQILHVKHNYTEYELTKDKKDIVPKKDSILNPK
jgi:hypothetical protein